MTAEFPPLIRGTMSHEEHHGIGFHLSIETLSDGRFDTWIRFDDSAPNVIGYDVGIFTDWNEARVEGLAKAHRLIENMPAAQRQNLDT